jgi:hypothetical protein
MILVWFVSFSKFLLGFSGYAKKLSRRWLSLR